MFTELKLRNFRTHLDTTLNLGPVTLIIGPNGSGKSNILGSLLFLSFLARRSRFYEKEQKASRILPRDFFPNRHRLLKSQTPITIGCTWSHTEGKVQYEVELVEGSRSEIAVREWARIESRRVRRPGEFEVGADYSSDMLRMQATIAAEGTPEQKWLARSFFRDLGSLKSYHWEPSALKGARPPESEDDTEEEAVHVAPAGEASDDEYVEQSGSINIAALLKYHGSGLEECLLGVKKKQERTYNQTVAKLETFHRIFRGISVQPPQAGSRGRDKGILWLFNLGRHRFDGFPTRAVSDGLTRAAAVALLCAMYRPPGLIALEEIENGLDLRNVANLVKWLRDTAGSIDSGPRGYKVQFLVTSHSPLVLREFSEHLDRVYQVRLQEKTHESIVRDLATTVRTYVDAGVIPGEYLLGPEGERIVKITKDRLLDLWLRGLIGSDIDAITHEER